LIPNERRKKRKGFEMVILNMNTSHQNLEDTEPIDELFLNDAETEEDRLFKGDRLDDLEYVYLEKKKRRLISKYTEKRYIP
jgi:hypothetical protein